MAKRTLIPWCLFLGAFLAVLVLGLDPKGYDFSNHVSRIAGSPGLRFEKYGIAYARLDRALAESFNKKDGFSVLMVFQPKQLDNNGSGHLLTIHSGDDARQFVIWQWFSHIIAMNGDDYAHRRKMGRVSFGIPSSPAPEIYLSLTTGPGGTTLYFDGLAVASNPSLQLNFPCDRKTTLVLGNSIYGNGAWHGTVSGLALIDRELRPESVASLYSAWIENKSFAETEKVNPSLLYLFDESEGSPNKDRITGTAALLIPDSAAPLTKQVLLKSLGEPIIAGSLLRDVIVNLIGFVPLGFFFIAAVAQTGGKPRARAVIYSVLFCFTVSLAIEVLQAWVPSRSSQFLDLLLNTAGGYAGALLFKKQSGRLRLLIGE